MTIRLDMLSTASRAIHVLGDSADLVAGFIAGQYNPDGGFKGRTDRSDLYYTVFGVEALLALNAEIDRERTSNFLRQFGDGASLDLVHLACLIRCWADLSQSPGGIDPDTRNRAVEHLEEHCSADGGYGNAAGTEHGTAYGCFLALGAYQDLDMEMPNPGALADCVKSLQTPNGAYSNEPTGQAGTTPATAAALVALHYLNEPVDSSSIDWLLEQVDPRGGFTATPGFRQAGMPDLLSTATALHALGLIGVATDGIKEQCLDFLDSLWDDKGGFRGNWADEILDCEYTYYGLLAVGRLSES